MTRQWVSDKDHNWVMACDQTGCTTRSEPFPKSPDLEIFQQRGWFIGALSGDTCPTCLANGVTPTAQPYRPPAKRGEQR
jgi:hypothetical protein